MFRISLSALIVLCSSRIALAQFIVQDPVNLVQNVLSVLQETAQVSQTIEQITNQLKSYKLDLTNSRLPDIFVWQDAESILEDILQAHGEVEEILKQYRSLDEYLETFGSLEDFRTSCYKNFDCTPEERKSLKKRLGKTSEAAKVAHKANVRAIVAQQKKARATAKTIKRLQAEAESAEGVLQALQAGNQLLGELAVQGLTLQTQVSAMSRALTTHLQDSMGAANNRAAADEAVDKAAKSSFWRVEP